MADAPPLSQTPPAATMIDMITLVLVVACSALLGYVFTFTLSSPSTLTPLFPQLKLVMFLCVLVGPAAAMFSACSGPTAEATESLVQVAAACVPRVAVAVAAVAGAAAALHQRAVKKQGFWSWGAPSARATVDSWNFPWEIAFNNRTVSTTQGDQVNGIALVCVACKAAFEAGDGPGHSFAKLSQPKHLGLAHGPSVSAASIAIAILRWASAPATDKRPRTTRDMHRTSQLLRTTTIID